MSKTHGAKSRVRERGKGKTAIVGNRWREGIFKDGREDYEFLKGDAEQEIGSIVRIIKFNDHR